MYKFAYFAVLFLEKFRHYNIHIAGTGRTCPSISSVFERRSDFHVYLFGFSPNLQFQVRHYSAIRPRDVHAYNDRTKEEQDSKCFLQM